MPLYEYECESCKRRFERIQKFSDPPVDACPVCAAPVRKLPSSPAFQFKGSGFYITDYPKKGVDGSKPEEGRTESSGSSDSSAASPSDSSSSSKDSASSKDSTSSKDSASSSKDSSSTESSSSTKPTTTPKSE